jgi:hypothetical protein
MIDTRFEELMWQKIDGEISAADGAELEAYLNGNEEAAAHYRELVSMIDAIGRGEEVDVPASLRPRIDAAIDWGRYDRAPVHAASGWLQRLFPRTGWDLRVVPMAVAAAVVGIIAYHIAGSSGPRGDDSRFFGAMTPPSDHAAPQVQIDLEGVQGTVGFRTQGDITVSEISLSSEREIELEMRYEGETLEFNALGAEESPLEGVVLNENALAVRNVGANRYHFVFRSDSRSEPVRVRVSDDHGLLLEREWMPDAGNH